MAIFNSYVCLPEGTVLQSLKVHPKVRYAGNARPSKNRQLSIQEAQHLRQTNIA